MFFCNNQTQSRILITTFNGKNQQLGTGYFEFGLAKNCLVIRGSQKPLFPAKTLIGHWRLYGTIRLSAWRDHVRDGA
jgi:hypothetical protein